MKSNSFFLLPLLCFLSLSAVAEEDKSIKVSELAPPGIEEFGYKIEGKPTFAETLWQGALRSEVESMLAEMPVSYSHQALEELALRLLSAPAKVPPMEKNGDNILAIRLYKLAAMGHLDIAAKIIEGVPATAQRDEKTDHAFSDILFITRSFDKSCEIAGKAAEKYDDPYWAKRRAFCLAREGKKEEMEISLAVAGESTDGLSLAEKDLLKRIAEISQKAEKLTAKPQLPETVSPSQILLAESAQVAVSSKIISASAEKMSLGELKEVQESGALDADSRAWLLEKIIANGDGNPDELAELYNKLVESPAKTKDESLKARAQSFVAISGSEGEPAEKEKNAAKFVEACENAEVLPACGKLLAGMADSLQPFEDKNLNSKIGKLLINEKQFTAAAKMLEPQFGANNILPRLLGKLAANDLKGLVKDAEINSEQEGYAGKLIQFVTLVSGAADNAEAKSLSGLTDITVSQKTIKPEIISGLQSASEAKQIGKTVSLSLIILGSNDVSDIAPFDLASVITALKAAGLEKESRAVIDIALQSYAAALVR